MSGRLKGIVVLAADFSDRLGRGETAPIQVLVDGSDPNTAGLVQTYVQGLWSNWLDQEAASRDTLVDRPKAAPPVVTEVRVWFNPDLDSQYALLPGAVAIVLTLIGTLADVARGRARVGARHDGGPAGHPDHAGRAARRARSCPTSRSE